MTNYRKGLKKYLADLAAKKPSPGGGSVAALTFCLGVSLIEKALRYSAKNYDNIDGKLKSFNSLRLKVANFIDLDGEIFDKVMRAKGKKRNFYLKKSDEVMRLTADSCREAASIAKTVERGIKKCIVSDFSMGRELIALSLKGCMVNIRANAAMFNESK